jgi:hypothetical protein
MRWSYSTYHSSLPCSSARPNARAPRFRPHASSPPGSLSSSFGAALAHTLRGIELHACLAHVRGHGLDGRASGESTPCRPERRPRPLMITDDAEALQRDRLAEGAWTVRPVGCPRGPSPLTTHSAHLHVPPLRWRTDAAGWLPQLPALSGGGKLRKPPHCWALPIDIVCLLLMWRRCGVEPLLLAVGFGSARSVGSLAPSLQYSRTD